MDLVTPISKPRRQTDLIKRMLEPKSLAVIGASEKNPFLARLFDNADAVGIDLVIVNPRQAEVFGRPAVPSLLDGGRKVDTVLSLVGADNTLEVVREAAQVGAAGVIVTAARFGETGPEGAEKERELRELAATSGLAICGPNCLGAYNVTRSIHLYLGAERSVRKGHVALVSQSGGLFTALQLAANEKLIGFSHMLSTGNEAATDLVDFLEFLVDDPDTEAVGMVIEQVRRPAAFLKVAARARGAGKFLAALKIGRSPAGQVASASHTGALMADAREYDVAFRQAGIEIAENLDDLLGTLQLFSHFPRRRWASADRVAVLTASGGVAALVADDFDEAGLALPQDPAIAAEAAELIPGTLAANPLDITGVFYNDAGFTQILDLFLASPSYDTIMAVNYLQEGMEAFARPLTEPMRRAQPGTDKRLIAVSASETAIAPWASAMLDEGIALGSGLGATVRSLAAMHRFIEGGARPQAEAVDSLPPPDASALAGDGGERLLSFRAAANLLEAFGIPTAPYVVWGSDRPSLPPASRYVVKLADVPHRTELGGVRVGVDPDNVDGVVAELRALALGLGVSPDVVVQPMLEIDQELFIGAKGMSTFGPLVVFGIGGTAVEALGDVAMRTAPLTDLDARELLAELRAARLLDEFRGRPGVDRTALERVLVNAGRLAAAASGWLDTLDINPLISNGDGLAAVDVAITVRTPTREESHP